MAVGPNIFFDPSREELAVADVVLALTFSSSSLPNPNPGVKLLAIRMVDPPGRRVTTGGTATTGTVGGAAVQEGDSGEGEGVWRKRAGGVRREVVRRMVDLVVRKGGVGEEVLAGLEGWV